MGAYSIKDLKRLGQEPARTHDGWYGKLVGRKVSVYFTRFLLPLGVTANQATLFSIGFGVAGSVLLAFNKAGLSLLGVLLLQLWFVFDCVDGEIARVRNQSSINGLFLDLVGHCVVDPLTFICLAFAAYQGIPKVGIFALAFSASLSIFINKQLDLGCQDSAIIEVYKKAIGKTNRSLPVMEGYIEGDSLPFTTPQRSKLRNLFSSIIGNLFTYTSVVLFITGIVLLTTFLPPLSNSRPVLYLWIISFYGLLLPLWCIYQVLRILKTNRIRNRYLQLFGNLLSREKY